MKRPLRIVAIVLASLLALGLCAVGLNRLVYGRSLRATLYEYNLRRHYATDRTAESETERLEARRREPEPRAALPKNMAFSVPIEETETDGLQLFTLNGGGTGPLVVYLHGGAYVGGFNAHQWRFMDRLSRETGCTVIAPAYHLAPWSDYTRAYEDLTALHRALLAECPCRRLILMGDSAGAGWPLGWPRPSPGRAKRCPSGWCCSPPGWTYPWTTPTSPTTWPWSRCSTSTW